MSTGMDPTAAQRFVDEKLAAARNAVAAGNRNAFIDAINSISIEAPVPPEVRTQLSEDVWNALIDNVSPRLQALLAAEPTRQQEAGA